MVDWRNKYSKIPPKICFDDLVGCTYCKTIFSACVPDEHLDAIFTVDTSHNFLLCGKAGNGKRTLARAFGREMVDNGYSYVRMRADHLIGESDSETCENIKSFFNDVLEASVSESAKGCYIFLEDISNMVSSKLVCAALDRKLEMIANDSKTKTIVVATAEDLAEIPSALKRTMTVCMAELPDEDDREDYLKSRLDKNIYIERSVSYQQMSEITEGFNFDMLNKLVTAVFMLAKQFIVANAQEEGVSVGEYLNTASFMLNKRMFEDIVDSVKVEDKPVPAAGVDVSALLQNLTVQNIAPVAQPGVASVESVVKSEPAVKEEKTAETDGPQGDFMDRFMFYKGQGLDL
ncbi:MAG: ATP-binding protein [Acutalibacteraceae bacterium]|nr:ATP-binding protein [Acutalibacteraceae bacterium]